MAGRYCPWLKSMSIELHMMDNCTVDPNSDVILGLIHQTILQARGGTVPAADSIIQIQIGMASGFIKVIKKTPAVATKYPPGKKPSEFLKVEMKKLLTRGSPQAKWAYRPNPVEPLWEDEAQYRNAQLLKTYLTNPKARRLSPLVLMDGAPGTGKSMVIDYVLSKMEKEFSMMKLVNVASAYIGETANNIIEMTREAIERKPSIVIIEEADGTFLSRMFPEAAHGSSRLHAEELVSTLLQCLDMMAREKDVFVIATTNMNPDDVHIMDPAILNRVGMRLSFRNPPEEVVRKVMRVLSERDSIPVESVETAMSEIVGETRKPNYRDITTAINRVQLTELTGLQTAPAEPKKPKEPKELEYIR